MQSLFWSYLTASLPVKVVERARFFYDIIIAPNVIYTCMTLIRKDGLKRKLPLATILFKS
jgi:hypothetical protein